MASKDDMFYKLVINHRLDLFWKTWEQYHPEGHYSNYFMDLISSMLDFLPSKRLLMADLIGHPWMQGEVATEEQVRLEFARRQEVCKARASKELLKKNIA